MATQQMTREEAQRQVARVRDGLTLVNNALRNLHAGCGWLALGYGTFAAMCDQEFGLSERRAFQRLDHSKTVAHMYEVLGLPQLTETELHKAIPERLARDIRDNVDEVAELARDHIAALPDGLTQSRRTRETAGAVHAAARQVRDDLRQRPPLVMPKLPRRAEQGRRAGYPAGDADPWRRTMGTGRAHAEAVRVLLDSRTKLGDAEKMQLFDLRDEIARTYEALVTAWAGETATGRPPKPVTDPFSPPVGG